MNPKILIVLFAISIAAAVPVKPERDNTKEIYQKLMVKQFKQSKTQLEARKKGGFPTNYPAITPEPANVNYRLPNNTTPLHYNVRITTNVNEGDFIFQGLTRITIKVLEPTNTITLHANQMIVDNINLFNSNMQLLDYNLNFLIESETQFLVVLLSRGLLPDREVILQVEHSGILRTDRLGFYRTSYNVQGTPQPRWAATTLFEPTHARHAFPCYDEIRYRTPFDISIVHDSSYHALSNMPVARTEVGPAGTTTIFETTPPMPVYNVAFTISDFDFVSNDDEKLLMRVYAQPAEIADGRADDALELGEKMWRALERIFGVPYPLPKSDIVAIDTSRNGESWGIIKINEWDVSTAAGIEESKWRQLQIAHEYSVSWKQSNHFNLSGNFHFCLFYQHAYFSNLISPSDWSYLW
jgi:aminopeptidase N